MALIFGARQVLVELNIMMVGGLKTQCLLMKHWDFFLNPNQSWTYCMCNMFIILCNVMVCYNWSAWAACVFSNVGVDS